MNDYWAEQEYTCAPPDPVTPPDTERLDDWYRLHRDACGTWEIGRGKFQTETNGLYIAQILDHLPALLDTLEAAEHRATRAEARAEALRINLDYWQIRARDMNDERDSWEQIALDEREGARDLLEQVNVRDVRIGAWEQQYTQDTDSLTREVDEADARIRAAVAILDGDVRWQDEEHLLARVRAALEGEV